MKTLLILLLFSSFLFPQSDTLKVKESDRLLNEYRAIQKEYRHNDSLQIRRLGIMDYIYMKHLKAKEREEKLKKKK